MINKIFSIDVCASDKIRLSVTNISFINLLIPIFISNLLNYGIIYR